MTLSDLQTKVTTDGNSFSQKLTVWGSEYIVINNIKFRLSDHDGKYNPSVVDVVNYAEIITYLKSINNYSEIKISNQDFIKLYLNGGFYNNVKIEKEGIYFENGFGLFESLESAANNLWYKTFK